MKPAATPSRICNGCGKTYYYSCGSKTKFNRKKYCTIECYQQHRTTNKTSFKKGNVPWNKGLHIKNNNALDIYYANGGKRYKIPPRVGNNHHNWKEDEVGYYALHNWVKRYKPISKCCEDCGITIIEYKNKFNKNFDLANISGEYKRDINDYKWLCRKCHHKFDNISMKMWVTRHG